MDQASLYGMTRATTSGLLTATGAETVYDTTVAIAFSVAGKAYSLAAVTDGATPTADGDSTTLTTLTANQGCSLVWCINAAGTVAVFQGNIEALDASGNFIHTPDFPTIDRETWCPFAYQVLKAGATAGTITIGTSNWNATGFTNVIVNVHSLPTRPQDS